MIECEAEDEDGFGSTKDGKDGKKERKAIDTYFVSPISVNPTIIVLSFTTLFFIIAFIIVTSIHELFELFELFELKSHRLSICGNTTDATCNPHAVQMQRQSAPVDELMN